MKVTGTGSAGRRRCHRAAGRKRCSFKRCCYFEATDTTERNQLQAFSQELARVSGNQLLAEQPVASWSAALAAVAQFASTGERTLVVLDEFQYVARQQPELATLLNTWWRTVGRDLPLVLVIAGSEVSFFREEVLGGQMYGRRDGQLALAPFDHRSAALFVPGYSAEDKKLLLRPRRDRPRGGAQLADRQQDRAELSADLPDARRARTPPARRAAAPRDGQPEVETVLPNLDAFVSKPAWERICQEHIGRHEPNAVFVGAWWGKVQFAPRRTEERELDAVALDRAGDVLATASCKWTSAPMDYGEEKLLTQVEQHVPGADDVRRHWFFSRAGFTDQLRRLADSDLARHRLVTPEDIYR
ncbi:DUF234 domain-containing protein [Conexibacter sp. CPCC 206217]|nr:DUF234 domain-containing protein [Conexibacter sp. CPCC 206217]MDO8209245.1 DUF234 domain-containing protein [Conexibacter sp. CPCC 206217]